MQRIVVKYGPRHHIHIMLNNVTRQSHKYLSWALFLRLIRREGHWILVFACINLPCRSHFLFPSSSSQSDIRANFLCNRGERGQLPHWSKFNEISYVSWWCFFTIILVQTRTTDNQTELFFKNSKLLGRNFMRHLGYFWPNYKHYFGTVSQGVRWIHWSFITGIFLLGGSHLWPYLVNIGTSIIWCDSNIKVQYFSVWLWYTLCSPHMAYHHNDRLREKVSWLLANHIPIKLLFLFCTQLN